MKTSKITFTAVAAGCAACALFATPSTNSLEAVKADWYEGRYTNVYELAVERFASNSNDLVAAHLAMEYETCFGSREAFSNSVMRLVEITDTVTHPALTNEFAETREDWIWYATEFLPSRTDEQLEQHRAKCRQIHRVLSSDYILEMIDDAGLW